jgi:hypothetical protein
MRRQAAALAIALALGSAAGCAELTTTGEPADGEALVEQVEQPGEEHGSDSQAEDTEAIVAETEEFAATLVGTSAEEAEAAADAAGVTYRVVMVDGEPRAVTLDYRPDRVNVAIEDDVVTEATVG